MCILKQSESVPENFLPVLQFKTSTIFYSECWRVTIRLLGGFVLSTSQSRKEAKGHKYKALKSQSKLGPRPLTLGLLH